MKYAESEAIGQFVPFRKINGRHNGSYCFPTQVTEDRMSIKG